MEIPDPAYSLVLAITRSRSISPRTKRIYRRAVMDFLRWVGPDPAKWTFLAVHAWHTHLKSSGRPATLYLYGLKFAARRRGLTFADQAVQGFYHDPR